eukprot:jgi/Chrzof1/5908/Cz16g20090.t1
MSGGKRCACIGHAIKQRCKSNRGANQTFQPQPTAAAAATSSGMPSTSAQVADETLPRQPKKQKLNRHTRPAGDKGQADCAGFVKKATAAAAAAAADTRLVTAGVGSRPGVDAGQVLNVGTAIGTAGVGGGNTAVTVARGCATGVEAGVSGVLNNNTTGNRDAVLGTVQAHAVQRAVGEISGEAAKPVAAAACGKSQRVAMATDVRNSAASNWMQILDEKVPELQEAAQQLDIAAKQQPIQQAQAEIARQSDIIRDADAEITKLTANTS